MKNYRLNSTAADSITDEDVANTLADMPDEVAARVKDELIVPLLTSEYEWAQTAWEDYADAYGVTNGDEFFGMLYAADENYSVDGKIRIRSLMRSQTSMARIILHLQLPMATKHTSMKMQQQSLPSTW